MTCADIGLRTSGKMEAASGSEAGQCPMENSRNSTKTQPSHYKISPRSDEDRKYTYCMADIDTLCEELGIPWEAEKDIPFQSAVPFIGFLWDLERGEVSITSGKQEKYLTAITAWEESTKHTLEEVQKLYGKLLHACLVIPAGRAYLTQLEACMGIFHNRPRNSKDHASPDPSPDQPPSLTSSRTQMQALKSASASRLAKSGEPGDSSQDGRQTTETSAGQRQSVSSSWSSLSAMHAITRASTMRSMETIKESWKDGGKVAAGTGQQTVSSVWYTHSRKKIASLPTLDMFPVRRTQLTALLVENMARRKTSSLPSTSPITSSTMSSISTHLICQRNSALHEKAKQPSPPPGSAQPHDSSNAKAPQRARSSMKKKSSPTSKPATKRHRFSPEHRSTNGGPVRDHTRARASRKPAPYPPDLTPVPSTLRPHVFAQERLTRWRPTTVRTATDNQGRPTHLSAEDLARILEVMAGAWADGTLEVYGTGLLTWHAFCDKNRVSEDQRAPASPLLIASLIATLSGAFSGGTIANYVYGIRAWHILHGVPWKMVDPELEALLKAAEKATPPTSKRKKRQPYTKDFMVAIRGQLDLSTPLHAAVYACLTTTFWSAARVGEFTVKNLTSFDANKHVKPSNVTTTTDQNSFETTEFFIPSTKSEPTNRETVSWSRQNGDTDPETAFHNHIDVNSPPNGGHLFAYKVGSGYKPLTKHKFIQILTTAARAAGLEPLQGHGIRIGSTLEYLLRGIPFDVMKQREGGQVTPSSSTSGSMPKSSHHTCKQTQSARKNLSG
ncbi:unnamed protein product [Cyclocybe aegerita]|uniref:Uncharacterized protein n=1 Tax=Cyclocybe aegerita TaxID=1973307 RepID=A0A8S0XQH4_CYCAE|nr:unnamed protein product [Cyclocybe aegerita]